MRNLIIPIFVGLLSVSFIVLPTKQNTNTNTVVTSPASNDSVTAVNDAATSLYFAINLQEYGLSKEAFTYAWKGYHRH